MKLVMEFYKDDFDETKLKMQLDIMMSWYGVKKDFGLHLFLCPKLITVNLEWIYNKDHEFIMDRMQ